MFFRELYRLSSWLRLLLFVDKIENSFFKEATLNIDRLEYSHDDPNQKIDSLNPLKLKISDSDKKMSLVMCYYPVGLLI